MVHNEQNTEYIGQLLNKLITIPDQGNESFYKNNQNDECTFLVYVIQDGKLTISFTILIRDDKIVLNNTYLKLKEHEEITYREEISNFLSRLRKPNQERIINKIEEYVLTYG